MHFQDKMAYLYFLYKKPIEATELKHYFDYFLFKYLVFNDLMILIYKFYIIRNNDFKNYFSENNYAKFSQ